MTASTVLSAGVTIAIRVSGRGSSIEERAPARVTDISFW
jgi:hypothetical protein